MTTTMPTDWRDDPAVVHALECTKALVDAVTFDDSGVQVGAIRQGGNGGLLGRETIAKAEYCRKALLALGVKA